VYRGVNWSKKLKKWRVGIWQDHHYHYLGSYDSKEVAAYAYDLGCLKYAGPFAHTNFTTDERKTLQKYDHLIHQPQAKKCEYRGVIILARCRSRPYKARISMGGKSMSLGTYATAIEAARAYDAKAIELNALGGRFSLNNT
jgi:hypothetical protein